MSRDIYLDNAAATKMLPEVLGSMLPYFTKIYGNPSSFHSKGLEAKEAVDEAREKIANILNCTAKEVIFTGGGTESINLALKGAARANKSRGRHIITTKIEHHALLHACEYLEKKEGFEVTYLDVDKYGMVSPESIRQAIRDNTILVSIMYANNEIGTIEPIRDIGNMLKKEFPQILFHTDACQAGSYLSLDVDELGVDLLSLNGSKLYGPKGVGILYVRRGNKIEPIIHGGGQENRLRSGTENVPGIIGTAKAIEIAQRDRESESKRLSVLRDKLIAGITEKISKSFLNGHPAKRLPNNANITILDVEGEAMMLMLDNKGIYLSSGSACTSGSLDPSHVIMASGLPYEAAHGSLRFSLGRYTTEEDIDYVIDTLPKIVKELRMISPVDLTVDEVRGEK